MRSLASVTRLAPRSGSYEDGLEAYRSSRFETAIAELSRNADVRSQLLLTRSYLRAGRIEDALSTVWAIPKDLSHPELAERALLLGQTETALKAFDEALSSFGEASAYAMSAQSPALFADLEYQQAVLCYARGANDEFGPRLSALLERYVAASDDDAYVVPLAHSRARAYAALELVAAREHRRTDVVECARAAIAELEGEPIGDSFMLASAYVNLAIRARDLDLPVQAGFLQSRLHAIEWTPQIAGHQFTILTALGWCDALAGNHVGALRWFRQASNIAPDACERIVAVLSRASLALELDHGILAEDELHHALELAGRVDWDRMSHDRGLSALLQLAQVAAIQAPREARGFFERYRALKPNAGTVSTVRLDPRFGADEAYAEGRLARATGHLDLAALSLETAFEHWATLGFQWRASLAAIELAEIGVHGRFLAYASAYAEQRPLSWIARRVAALESAAYPDSAAAAR